MSETPIGLRREPGIHTEIIPPDSLLVIEQGYSISPNMQSPYQRNRCRLYAVVEGGGQLPPPEKPAHPLGYTPTDTVVTFLKPNEWTIATTETFSIQDRDPQQRYSVLNVKGRRKTYHLNRIREWQFRRKGYQFIEPGSKTYPPYSIILPEENNVVK